MKKATVEGKGNGSKTRLQRAVDDNLRRSAAAAKQNEEKARAFKAKREQDPGARGAQAEVGQDQVCTLQESQVQSSFVFEV